MLKRFSSLWLVVLTLLFVVSCGNKKDGGGETAANGPVTIDIWLTPQWKGVYDSKEAGADYDSFLKKAAKFLL